MLTYFGYALKQLQVCLHLVFLTVLILEKKLLFFSLDVEGAEWHIIQNIPWSLVDIQVWKNFQHVGIKLLRGIDS